jgi:acetyltransferase-like isoleucine patch superfamily enzyme
MAVAEFSRIASDVILGKDVKIFGLVNLYGCTIGDRTKIGSFVEIQKNAVIGSDCKISSHTFICEGVHIADKVFVGHGVTFVNDLYPEAVRADGTMQTDADWEVVPTYVEERASIGSNSTILCGITIGQSAIIGAGSVVTKDVPSHQIWAGNPARFLRKI